MGTFSLRPSMLRWIALWSEVSQWYCRAHELPISYVMDHLERFRPGLGFVLLSSDCRFTYVTFGNQNPSCRYERSGYHWRLVVSRTLVSVLSQLSHTPHTSPDFFVPYCPLAPPPPPPVFPEVILEMFASNVHKSSVRLSKTVKSVISMLIIIPCYGSMWAPGPHQDRKSVV